MLREETVTPVSTTPAMTPPPATQEVLVRDPRAGLTPAQMVERKLLSLLGDTPLSLSGARQGGTRPRVL